MPDNRNWQTELDEYIKLGEPTKAERSDAWKTAIGLQDVDGLKTSDCVAGDSDTDFTKRQKNRWAEMFIGFYV